MFFLEISKNGHIWFHHFATSFQPRNIGKNAFSQNFELIFDLACTRMEPMSWSCDFVGINEFDDWMWFVKIMDFMWFNQNHWYRVILPKSIIPCDFIGIDDFIRNHWEIIEISMISQNQLCYVISSKSLISCEFIEINDFHDSTKERILCDFIKITVSYNLFKMNFSKHSSKSPMISYDFIEIHDFYDSKNFLWLYAI